MSIPRFGDAQCFLSRSCVIMLVIIGIITLMPGVMPRLFYRRICEIIAKKFSIDPSGVNCYTVNGDVVVPLGFSTIVVNTKELENQIPDIMTLARSQIEDLVKEVYA